MNHRHTTMVITCLALAGCAAAGAPAASGAEGRAYELVSPADTGGNDLVPAGPSRFATPARPVLSGSSDGEALLFANIIGGLIDGSESGANNLYRSARTSAGWKTKYTGPPATAGGQYRAAAASDDLRRLIFQQDYGTRLDPSDPDPDGDPSQTDNRLFASQDGTGFTRLDRGSDMAPFETSDRVSTRLVAADPAATGGVFESRRRLEPEMLGDLQENATRLYRSVNGATELVSVDTNGKLLGIGGQRSWPASSDLKRIYIQGQAQGSNGDMVFLWNDGETVEASASKRSVPDLGTGSAALQDVSGDGRSAIFRTKRALTDDDAPDAGGPGSGQDLYRYELPESGDPTEATLTRLTGSTAGQGARLVAASRDHARVYFSSDAVLTPEAAAGGLNLYLRHGGTTTFVATLADADREIPNDSFPEDPFVASSLGEGPSESARQTRISDDGSVIVFRSQAALGGAPGGAPNLFRFDAADGGLECISCAPGADSSGDPRLETGGARGRNLTADGSQVYFTTDAALTAADTNGRADVYQYDAADGAPELVSDGTSPRGAQYVENSTDGRDVFFTTRDPLVPQDLNGPDEAQRLYDARIGGGFPVDVPQPPCVGEACRGLIADRPAATPNNSGAVTGAGDPPVAKAPATAAPARAPRLARVTRAQARSFARTGRLRLSVASLGGRIQLRGRVEELRGSRRVRLATGARTIKKATSAALTIRASRSGRARLRSGERLRLRIVVTRSGTEKSATRTITVPATRRAR